MSNSIAAAEAEARTLQAEIEQLQSDHAEKKTVAGELRASLASAGTELSADDMNRVQAAWLAADELNDKIAVKQNAFNSAVVATGAAMRTGFATASRNDRTWGERYVASDAYQNKVQSLAGRQFAKDDYLPRFEVASAAEATRYLASTDGSALIPRDTRTGVIEIPSRQVRIMDMVTVASTQSDAVEYVKESYVDDNAAFIAHSTPGAQGAPINLVETPLSEYRLTRETATVRRVGHHTIVPRSMLSDAPRLQSYIDGRLRRGVRLATEAEILNGTGAANGFDGLVNQAGNTQAHSDAADDLSDSIHRAMTLVRVAFEEDITGIVMHPLDFEDFVLQRGGDGNYQNGVSPFNNGPSTAWGYPVALTTLMTQGTILAGQFDEAVLYVREGIEVMSGFMERQLISDAVTLNAEYRAAFVVERPNAFASITRAA